MKLEFTCPRCKLSFPIESKYLKDKDSLCCPNCELQYPEKEFEILKESMKLFELGKNAAVEFYDDELGTTFSAFGICVSQE